MMSTTTKVLAFLKATLRCSPDETTARTSAFVKATCQRTNYKMHQTSARAQQDAYAHLLPWTRGFWKGSKKPRKFVSLITSAG